jgi:hypothetical protein
LLRRVASYFLLALVFFLLGFLPAWVRFGETAGRLSEAEQALRLAQIQNALGSAVIDTQRGNYEPALQSVSSFYTSLQAELDRGKASVFSPTQQAALQSLLSGRDALVALLAREDPAATTRLSDLYQYYSQIMSVQAAPEAQSVALTARRWPQADQAP